MDSPDQVALHLANGLAKNDISAVKIAGLPAAEADRQLKALTAGMGPIQPTVAVGALKAGSDSATATLRFVWSFPGVTDPWSYETAAELRRESGVWKAQWGPTLVHSQLSSTTRLSQRRLYPRRGELLGEDGDPLVTLRPVVRIGLDKAALSAQQAATSARRLARLVDINSAAYVAKVRAAGSQAFVEAIVLRATANNRPDNETVHAIPGALAIEGQQMLAPTRQFARPVIGVVGEASKEIVDASGGTVVAGDEVGLSGLQLRYDATLRGTPGVRVQLVPAQTAPSTVSPEPGASAGPTPGPTASPSPAPALDLYEVPPVDGRGLTITLNRYLQTRAEAILSKVRLASALVAIRPSTGALVAVANGPGTKDQSVATVGQYAPGSTFKVVSSLALLRAGLRPSEAVRCPPTIPVNGRTFENYDDYPASQLGSITLQRALAHSCNTAFIGLRTNLDNGALADAAGSLGMGVDYNIGVASFFGSVPVESTETGRAAAMIGQARVLASPLAMAAVAASVQAGRTLVPHLVDGQTSESAAKPLTRTEGEELRSMMAAVVSEGSGRFLAGQPGPPIIAKTGTAEYGTRQPPRTHAWMIAAQGDLAVAVLVADGKSGSATAGPLLADFLKAAQRA